MKKIVLIFALLTSVPAAYADVVCSTVPTTCTAAGSGGGGASTSADNTWTGEQTFIDNKFLIVDDGDPTKKAAFQLSGIGTGQTRTFTVPNLSGTLATINNQQTWTVEQDFSTITIAPGAFIGLGGGTGSTNANNIGTATTQTPDAGMLFTGTTSNSWIIAETQDAAFDFAHAAATHPTIFIHSANQSTSEWGSLSHNGSTFNINSGTNAGTYFSVAGTFRGGFVGAVGYFALDAYPRMASGVRVTWSSSASLSGTEDLILFREAAAILQMGDDVNGAAVAQTIKAHDGITGTNIAGANLTLAGGRGTGTGAGGNVILSAPTVLASGTTAQTLTSRETIVAKAKTLTDASATTVFTVTGLGAHIRTGGVWEFTVEAGDGTNDQVASCQANWNAIDTTAGAGGETCTVFLLAACSAADSGAASSGTLTVTADTSTGTDTCNFRLTATGSLTETVLQVTYNVIKNGVGTVNPQ